MPARTRPPSLRLLALAADLALATLICAGMAVRIVGVPSHVPDSGDEWGNTIAPLRLLYEHGDPNVFLHPSLYYYVTAAAYVVVFAAGRLLHLIPADASMARVMVSDPNLFIYTARAVSAAAALAAIAVSYRTARQSWGARAGLFAAALLSLLPLHVIYSSTARVDSLFVLLFLLASAAIAAAWHAPQPAAWGRAAVLVGLCCGANYNGGLLMPWLIVLQASERRSSGSPTGIARTLGIAVLTFLVTSPFVLWNPTTFARNFAFISGLSVAVHPGMEGRELFFYVRELLLTQPLLSVLIATSALLVVSVGVGRERLLLAMALGYAVVFSLIRSKIDRFILPGLALLMIPCAGVPSMAMRWARSARRQLLLKTAAQALVWISIAQLATTALTSSPPIMLARPDALLLEWLESNAAPRSNVLVESGIVPLIDTIKEPGTLAAELRAALVATHPRLDLHFIGAVYVGGRPSYDAETIAREQLHYAIVSRRNLTYLESRCEEYPEVCELYRRLRQQGQVVYETPDGVEPVVIYALDR